MNKPHLLQKLAPVGVAAIGAIAVTGISTAPAQAFTGSLGFTDNTSDFYVDPSSFAVGDIFEVTFNPTGIADNNVATGDFDDLFTSFQPYNATTVTGSFQVTDVPGDLPGIFYEVELLNDLSFIFPGPNDAPGTADFILEEGSTFDGEYSLLADGTPGGLEFELIQDAGSTLSLNGVSQPVDGIEFEFGDIPAPGNGEYAALASSTSVPEPATFLGLLTISGLGLGLKRKKQLWKAS